MPRIRGAAAPIKITAPRGLGVFRDRADATIGFLGRIRKATEDPRGRAVVIDFRPCRYISRAACLMITAELERGRHRCKGVLSFIPPASEELADLFDSFGVYAYFNIASPLSAGQKRSRTMNSIVVRSGDVAAGEVKFKLKEVASVALKVCGATSLAHAVEDALQEAMWNASEHAYADMDMVGLPRDRWWFAGVYDPENCEAFFYALDHGHGIPNRAQVLMAADLQAYWEADPRFAAAAGGAPNDPDRLDAAIRAPRLNAPGREGRGKGLPTMVGLVDDALDGEVRICSGAATWHGRRRKKAVRDGSNTLDKCYPLRREYPGTLVCWRVSGPLKSKAEAIR